MCGTLTNWRMDTQFIFIEIDAHLKIQIRAKSRQNKNEGPQIFLVTLKSH